MKSNYRKYIPFSIRMTPGFIFRNRGRTQVDKGGIPNADNFLKKMEETTLKSEAELAKDLEEMTHPLFLEARNLLSEYEDNLHVISSTSFSEGKSDLEVYLDNQRMSIVANKKQRNVEILKKLNGIYEALQSEKLKVMEGIRIIHSGISEKYRCYLEGVHEIEPDYDGELEFSEETLAAPLTNYLATHQELIIRIEQIINS